MPSRTGPCALEEVVEVLLHTRPAGPRRPAPRRWLPTRSSARRSPVLRPRPRGYVPFPPPARRSPASGPAPRGRRGPPTLSACLAASPPPGPMVRPRSGTCCPPARSRGPSSSSRPPTDEGERLLWQAIRELEPLDPSFVSVTYGAGGSTRDRTIRVTEGIGTDTTLTPLGHLTCVGSSRARAPAGRRAVRRTPGCATSWRCGATRPAVLARRGSSTPRACGTPSSWSPCSRSLGDFCVGRRGLPRGPPRGARTSTPTPGSWWPRPTPGADFAITQFFFAADSYFRARRAGRGRSAATSRSSPESCR